MAKNHHERVVQRNRALRSFAVGISSYDAKNQSAFMSEANISEQKSTIHLSLLIPLFDSEAPRPSSEFPRAEKSIISAGTTN